MVTRPERRSNGRASPASHRFQPYLDAAWGVKNYWYPALFADELGEGEVRGVTIAGVPILLRRAAGKVHALRDQCLHRGVTMSVRPRCFSDDTISCWYHGFTYDLETGVVTSIIGAPDDPLVGNARMQVFPTRELAGIVFVFVGDEEYTPLPDIADDLPVLLPADYEFRSPHPLDENVVILGIHRTGNSNWRLAVENGFDPGHQIMHRDAQVILAQNLAFPLGLNPTAPEAITVYGEDGKGPVGIMNEWHSGHYDLVMHNDALDLHPFGTGSVLGLRTSMYLPGVLMVENWPRRGLTQLEWYVPIDGKRHEYWEVILAVCNDEAELKKFKYEYEHLWLPIALHDFNDDDLFAREQMERFYSVDGGVGWDDEQLCGMDAVITGWRGLVSRHNRGIQTPQEHPTPRLR